LLYIGDDSSNEEVFSYLNQASKTSINHFILSPDSKKGQNKEFQIYTCTVGKKPSNAKYCFKDNRDMCNLLRDLSTESLRIKKNKSASDMNEAAQEEERKRSQERVIN
jgi:hypothetical protein